MLDPKCIYRKSIFAKCTRLACLLSFASLFTTFVSFFHLGLDKSAVHLSFKANNGRLLLCWEVVNALNWIPLPSQNIEGQMQILQ